MHNTAVLCMLMDIIFVQTHVRTDRPTIYGRQAVSCVWKLNVQSVILANGARTRGAHSPRYHKSRHIHLVCVWCFVYVLLVIKSAAGFYMRLFLSSHVTF